MSIRIPRSSPVHYLENGEWQVYCPDVRCGWAAPHRCELCGGVLRVAEVSAKGQRSDRPVIPIDIATEDDTDA